ncbi:free fatty acid receptor 2-like [Eublepharis macularius]|uniref:Free fatty acid receptor 2-like n=1 Tax=Eublepharis macularius TaxID=481883 RepID=A0AA97KG90_EUBMA|nr:free fatty acid receptor 2-like [Eublepharis macularius]
MASETAVLAIFLFTFLTGLPSNLLAFYTFLVKLRHKPTPIDILLLNLTLSDIILLLFLPFKMTEVSSHMTWTLPAFLCPLTSCCFYGSMYTSSLFLTSVSVDRYLSVAYPIKYKLNRRPVHAIVASIFIWLLACSHCSIIYVARHGGSNETLPYSPNTSHCYENFSPEQLPVILSVRLELSLFFFCLPFIITIFCYMNIIRILNSLSNVQSCKKQRAVGLAVATLLNFVICFALYNISHIVGFIQKEEPPWRVEGFLLSTLNTSVDPVIFFFSSKAIRRTFSDCWGVVCFELQALVQCCKRPTDNDEGADAGRISNSSLHSGYRGGDVQTETVLDQTAKTWETGAQNIPQQVQGTVHQESPAPWLKSKVHMDSKSGDPPP